jgi:hypothetical protein
MYEPSHIEVEDRAKLRAVLRRAVAAPARRHGFGAAP